MIVKRTLWSPAMTTNRPSGVAAPPEPFDLYDQGLQADVATLVDRRRVLQLMGLAGVGAFLAACAPGAISSATASAAASARVVHQRRGLRPRDPRGDRRPVPGRRHERARRPHRERRRAQRHHHVVRRVLGHGRRGAADDPAPDPGRGQRLRAARGRRGLHLALRPRGPLLALLPGRRGPELPARRPGGGRRRDGDVHQHLPRLLLGALAAHPLRGLPVAVRGIGRRQPDRDVPGGPAAGHLRGGLRGRRATSRASRTCSR